MKKFIKFILENIVENPEEITINETSDDIGDVIEINVAESDKPLVIGREGRNIKAIRALSSIVSKKEGKKVFIKIVD